MCGSQFSDAEEAFIEVNIPVVNASVAVTAATRQYDEAEQAVVPITQTLGEEFESKDLDDRSILVRTRDLMLESARRAGYEEDHEVFTAINAMYDRVLSYFDSMAAAQAEAVTSEATPVV